MNSNECPSIWDQPRLSSSIRLEMTVQQRQQRWEEKAEKISIMYEIKSIKYLDKLSKIQEQQ